MPEGVRVSVVMPVHNAAPYVEMAVQSALASDLRQLEVIVVDDGSEDQSAAIVEAISDPRVVLVRTPPSGGPSRPRNIGIARAKAPYVAFLDADDLRWWAASLPGAIAAGSRGRRIQHLSADCVDGAGGRGKRSGRAPDSQGSAYAIC